MSKCILVLARLVAYKGVFYKKGKMIHQISIEEKIETLFDPYFVSGKIRKSSSILLKINLARPPQKNHPRTDSNLLRSIIEYFLSKNKEVVICESSDGNLEKNLEYVGIASFRSKDLIKFVDIDEEDFFVTTINGQEILIPFLFQKVDLLISIPCTTKREDTLFSNNIKNFFGATPRIGYIKNGEGRWRSKLHDELTQSVINVFQAFNHHVKFDFYINGGNAYSETTGAFDFDRIFISNNAIELDQFIFKNYFSEDEKPEYLQIMERNYL